MLDLLVPLDKPQPDCDRFLRAVTTQYIPARPAMVEFKIEPEIARRIVTGLLGRTWVEPHARDRSSEMAYWSNLGEMWYRLGYDCIRLEMDCRLPYTMQKPPPRDDDLVGLDTCMMLGGNGPIRSWDDFANYPWPTVGEADLFPFEHLARVLPEGMGIMGGHEGGIFQHLAGLLGYDGLCLRLYDQPGLVEAVVERLGEVLMGYYERLVQIDRVVALFPGDDLGHAGGPFIGPEHMRQFILPWHARFAALAHEAGRAYFLHSYGRIDDLMPDLVDLVGIDAKHCFSEEVCPVRAFKRDWGARVGALGGVDPEALAGFGEEDLRRHVRAVIDDCQKGGGFAVGTGSAVSDKIPLENYLIMLDEVLRH